MPAVRTSPTPLIDRDQAGTVGKQHRGFCSGEPRPFILGYEFFADVLLLPLAPGIAPADNDEAVAFCRTLGKALVVGTHERLEIEQDEIASFHHPDGAGGVDNLL